jgi:hypothetical protein
VTPNLRRAHTFQVKQLKADNIVSPIPPLNSTSFTELLSTFPSSLPSSAPPGQGAGLKSVHDVLPSYLGEEGQRENGKRMHGRKGGGKDEIERMMRK